MKGMKVSKLSLKKSGKGKPFSGKAVSGSSTAEFKHQFRVISAEEVNQNRPKAYQFLAF